MEVMRNYTTKPMNGGITFKCVACGHSVNTLEFDYSKGNRRTQAAGAINRHFDERHFAQLTMFAPVKSGSRGAL
jgi:hypothetical protein